MTQWYTLSEVVKRTGAKRRSVQLWADGGVLESSPDTDRAGTGVHRSFDETEVQIAAVLAPLANETQIPIGHLRAVARKLRPALDVASTYAEGALFDDLAEKMRPLGYYDIIRGIKRAQDGRGQNFLLVAWAPGVVWLDLQSDEAGPLCINPRARFPEELRDKIKVWAMVDLTDCLRGVLE